MARPKKAPEELRDNQLNTALTDAELAEIEHKAALRGLTAADFMRRLALAHPLPPTLPEQRDRARRLIAFNKVAVNLNQLTHAVNAGRLPPIDELRKVFRRLDAMLDEIDGPDDH